MNASSSIAVIPPEFVFSLVCDNPGRLAQPSNSTYLLVATVAFLLITWVWRLLRDKNSSPDGPPGLPIIGHLPWLGDRPDKRFEAWSKIYGPVFRIQMGSRCCLVINGLEAARQALVYQAEDFADRPDFFSFGLISDGKSMAFGRFNSVYKRQRQVVSSALCHFSRRRRLETEEMICAEADRLVTSLIGGAQPCPVAEKVHISTASVIFSLCFGNGSNIREEKSFIDYLRDDEVFGRIMSTGKCIADIFPWTIPILRSRGYLKEFTKVQKSLLSTIRNKVELITASWLPSQPRNVVDILRDICSTETFGQRNNENFTESHLMDLPVELVGAGHSTASISLRWALLFMAEFPHVQEKVHAEVDAILGSGRSPIYKDRWEMPWCEAVLLETLRFATIQPFLVPHATTRRCKFYGFEVARGTLILVNQRSVLRDPSVWKEPDRFDPSRFLDPKTGGVDRYLLSVTPSFGLGKRKCPGEAFARLELFLVFVRVMQRLRICRPEGSRLDLEGKWHFAVEPLDQPLTVEIR